MGIPGEHKVLRTQSAIRAAAIVEINCGIAGTPSNVAPSSVSVTVMPASASLSLGATPAVDTNFNPRIRPAVPQYEFSR
jgi:hypothetical protein